MSLCSESGAPVAALQAQLEELKAALVLLQVTSTSAAGTAPKGGDNAAAAGGFMACGTRPQPMANIDSPLTWQL